MYAVHPMPPHVQQVTAYDCWHAALRMMCKWRNGGTAEPYGTHTDWLYRKCREAANGYATIQARELEGTPDPSDVDRYQAGREAKRVVATWSQTVRLRSTSSGEFSPFRDRPGLTLALLPTILGENRLRAVRGETCIRKELGAKPEAVEAMLRDYGPLYCLVSYGHVVVIVGVDGNRISVLDPQMQEGDERDLGLLKRSPCVARIA